MSADSFQQFQLMLARITEIREDDAFAQRCYGALCNQGWRHENLGVVMSWRTAGRLIAEIRDPAAGCYLEFYCSGEEGVVHPDVQAAFAEHGWEPCDFDEAADLQRAAI